MATTCCLGGVTRRLPPTDDQEGAPWLEGPQKKGTAVQARWRGQGVHSAASAAAGRHFQENRPFLQGSANQIAHAETRV